PARAARGRSDRRHVALDGPRRDRAARRELRRGHAAGAAGGGRAMTRTNGATARRRTVQRPLVRRLHGPAGRTPAARARSRLSSVANAVRLIKVFSDEDHDLGISDLARRLGLAKSTVHRLAATLIAEGLLEQNAGDGKY